MMATIVRLTAPRTRSLLTALPSIMPVLCAAVFALCLLFLARGISLRLSADGILPSIMALQKLTVYFWGQDRFGNLTGLLTVWLRDPVANVYAQMFLRLAAGLAAPVFYAALVFRHPSEVWRAALLSDCLLLCVGGGDVMHETFVEASPYGTSLACAGLASLALRAPARRFATWMRIAAAALLLAAYVVNFGLVIIALPLVVVFAVLFPSAYRARLAVLHVIAAALAYLLPAVVAPGFQSDLGLQASLPALLRYAGVVWHATGWLFFVAALLPGLLLGVWLWRCRRWRHLRLSGVVIGALLALAACNFVVVASSRWLVINEFHVRYFVPGFLLLMSAGGVALWLAAMLSLRAPAFRAAAFIVAAAVLLLFAHRHLHAHQVNEDFIEARRSELARAVGARYVALPLDGIAGDYWDVWPSVLMAEQYQYLAGYRGLDVLGVTYRGEVRREEFIARLATRGRLRLACIDLDPPDCAARASSVMKVPGLRFTEFAKPERLPGEHRLGFVEIAMPAPPEP